MKQTEQDFAAPEKARRSARIEVAGEQEAR
jgi:hypothetical protein